MSEITARLEEIRRRIEAEFRFKDLSDPNASVHVDSLHMRFLYDQLEASLKREAALVEALEFECGNRCHPEHNPCNAREALTQYRESVK